MTVDPSQAMHPDVVAAAERLPFPDQSFDIVVNRLAAHHFSSVADAVGEFARVTRELVVIEDHCYTDEQTEQAERLRDPSHGRALSEAEWRALLTESELDLERVHFFEMELDFASWFARTNTSGSDSEHARELLAPLSSPDGLTWTSPMIIMRARRRR